MNKYWIVIDDKTQGPFSLEHLKTLGLWAGTPVWREGFPDWIRAGELDELAPWTHSEESGNSIVDAGKVTAAESEESEVPVIDDQVVEDETVIKNVADNEESVTEAQDSVTRPVVDKKPRASRDGKITTALCVPVGEIPEGYMAIAPAGEPKCPPSYLAMSIVSTLLFFLPLGVCAIFCSSKVEPHYKAGRYEQAYKMSQRAQLFIVLSIVCCLIWLPFSVVMALI